VLEAAGERLALLQRYAGFLEDLFIVSGVSLGSATATAGGETEPLSVRVERAEGRKCERCWHIRKDVGQDAEFRTVCARCVRAVHAILGTRGAGV
jgi:isoleucyl-tRNA synthetase